MCKSEFYTVQYNKSFKMLAMIAMSLMGASLEETLFLLVREVYGVTLK